MKAAIQAKEKSTEDTAVFRQQEPPKLIPGVQLKGIVRQPDGQPAADIDVGLQVNGKYLALGKGDDSRQRAPGGWVAREHRAGRQFHPADV